MYTGAGVAHLMFEAFQNSAGATNSNKNGCQGKKKRWRTFVPLTLALTLNEEALPGMEG